ncbi:MAG: tetratricopeptide repeat protein [Burkholderiaceae bacterium]|jgi:Flp pilus assembly protein TadD|nr:tetratricopeptide repeat protein [Burkholderiaceae bacterium]MCU0964756.1 tetratricopeptide repeat protein [Burkholderiaceae bacterium]
MSTRSSWTALVLAVACLSPAPLRADELQDIEKLYRAGDVQQALRKADEAIAAQPRAAQVRFLKGVMLTDLKRNAQAIEVFTLLTQDFPELPDPYNNLAVLFAAEGQLQSALVALQTALRNDPAHRAARENLGDVYLALAIQAWAAAQSGAKGDDAGLGRKLQLARQIQALPLPPAPPRPAG